MNPSQPYITLSECVDRGIYVVRSRNLGLGVFDAAVSGFIGIRTKFRSRYLFTEYHWDTGAPHGTVCPTAQIATLPQPLQLLERTPTVCSECWAPVVFTPESPEPQARGTWWHEDGTPLSAHGGFPSTSVYEPLFTFLSELEDRPDVVAQIKAQWDWD